MARGPSLGTVSYNGFAFPGPVVVKLRCTPVRDFANRTTKYYHYLIVCSTVVIPSDLGSGVDNDSQLGPNRKKLMTPGQRLTITGHGLGSDIDVDGSTCIGFGPIPMDYQSEIVGANQAARLIWSVEFNSAHCQYGGISAPSVAIGDLCYGINYSIDESGLTTRTITGQAEIAVFANGQSITATADSIIDTINPVLPEGFLRRKGYTISDDKRFLNFVITDRELGSASAYPNQIVRAEIDFGIRGDLQADAIWECEVSGSLEVAQGYAKGFALEGILTLAKTRIDKILSGAGQQDDNQVQPAVILETLSINDSLYSQKLDVSLSFIVNGATLKNLLATSGAWEPIGGGWTNWQQSDGIKTCIMRPRGYANLSSQASDDVIVSFCQPGEVYSGPKYQGPTQPYSSNVGQSQYNTENSWVKYDLDISWEKDSTTLLHRAAGASNDSQTPLRPYNTGDGGTVTGGVSDGGTHYVPGEGQVPNAPSLDFQERAPAEVHLILRGHAIRIGYPIAGSDLAYIANGWEDSSWTDGPKRIGFTPERIPIYKVNWGRNYRQLTPGNITAQVNMGTAQSARGQYVKFAPP